MSRSAPIIFIALVAAFCGLCLWQWQRESALRDLAVGQERELIELRSDCADAEFRAQVANAEILRLTGAVSELRQNTVPQQTLDETRAALQELRDHVAKQAAAITQRDQNLTKMNETTVQANAMMKKLTQERDELARRLNEVTRLYNQKK
jgi:predicted nuclease with TOPRIM domain